MNGSSHANPEWGRRQEGWAAASGWHSQRCVVHWLVPKSEHRPPRVPRLLGIPTAGASR